MRICVVCGTCLDGMRSDARYCGPPCRAEASRLKQILDGRGLVYQSVHERIKAWRVVNEKAEVPR